MSEVAVENVNVAEIFEKGNGLQCVEEVTATITADPEVGALVKAAQSIEDVYDIVKRFSKATLAQVKALFEKTVDYFKETKAALSDEVLDNVVGGWSLSAWWNKNKADIIGGTIFVACIVGGIIIGAATGGVGGAVVGAAAGFVVGATLGGVAGAVVAIVDTYGNK